MAIEIWPIERIKPYPGNPRKISKEAIAKVAASLKEYGWQQPIVVDAKGVIVVGHTRRLAAIELGWKEAPVHVARGLSAAQIRAYRLMDNRSNQESRWDNKLLGLEIAELSALAIDVATMTGFGTSQLDQILLREAPEDVTAELLDKADELLVKWKVERGQLWTIGPHRLVCGSCTDPADAARAVGDHKPFLLVTDPPYGIELDMEWRDRRQHNELGPANKSYMKAAIRRGGGQFDLSKSKKVMAMSGDTRADWSEAFELVPSLDVAYIWHASRCASEVEAGLERIGFEIRQQIIWVKPVAAMSRQAYHWKHEPCWYAVRKQKNARWAGGREQTTVWEASSPKQIFSHGPDEKLPHPTQKPIELLRISIINHGDRGDVVYEPFGGSGTTMAAAELCGRICCAIEIEPRYCAIILERMLRQYGIQGELATPSNHPPTTQNHTPTMQHQTKEAVAK